MTDNGWTNIEIDGSEDEDDLTVEIEEEEEGGEEAKEEEVKKPQKKSEAVEDDDEFGQLGKRAQKRIRGLIKKTKEKDEQISQLMERLEALEQRTTVSEVRGRSQGTRRELQNAVDVAEKEFMDAIDEGDKVKQVKAQNKLLEAKMKLAKLDEFDQGFEEEVKKNSRPVVEKEEAAPGLHKEVDRWLKKNPQVAGNRVLLSAAGAIAAELEEEGYGPDDPEYFEEVETRMKSMGLWKDEEAASKPNRVVNGQSRTAGKKTVKLTPDEKRLCDTYGISYADYAKEKVRVEKPDHLGYTVLEIARRNG